MIPDPIKIITPPFYPMGWRRNGEIRGLFTPRRFFLENFEGRIGWLAGKLLK
jgi:hypothetical protein